MVPSWESWSSRSSSPTCSATTLPFGVQDCKIAGNLGPKCKLVGEIKIARLLDNIAQITVLNSRHLVLLPLKPLLPVAVLAVLEAEVSLVAAVVVVALRARADAVIQNGDIVGDNTSRNIITRVMLLRNKQSGTVVVA